MSTVSLAVTYLHRSILMQLCYKLPFLPTNNHKQIIVTTMTRVRLFMVWALVIIQPSYSYSGKPNRLNDARQEVFAFLNDCTEGVWTKLDWNKLTTIAVTKCFDPEFISFAHQRNVKVVIFGTYPVDKLLNKSQRMRWIHAQLEVVQDNNLNGLNIDFEDPLVKNSVEVNALNELAVDATRIFHKAIPTSQVSFDVAWSPNCVDGRCYDYLALSNAVDLIFVMSYDEQSQIFDQECTAKANSGLQQTKQGLKDFISLGISPTRMILGVPWYGYDYTCLQVSQNNTCHIKQVPFRGINCSDAAGIQIPYGVISGSLLPRSSTGRLWDDYQKAPYFNFKNSSSGSNHQIWYDDAESLRLKYNLVEELGLRGVGMWSADQLDYSNTKQGKEQRDTMWGAIPTSHHVTMV